MNGPRPGQPANGVAPIEQWWPRLPSGIREWLIDHNGEHLPRSVVDAIVDAAEGLDSAWWAGGDDPDASQLTDAAVDWIDEFANGEHH